MSCNIVSQTVDMLFAIGWVVVRSSREPYARLTDEAAATGQDDEADDVVEEADRKLFAELEAFLTPNAPPDLDWHFRPGMSHKRDGILHLSSVRNHRGSQLTAVDVLTWLAEHGPGSYGLVYLHDDEDLSRTSNDHSNEFRVWRLRRGLVEELSDPFFSPIIPSLDPNDWA